MRTLPDSPSLAFLRRQAKDLLVGMRASRPEASLSDAQTALARQYGFLNWPELKAEVARRADRSELATEELAQRIATRFGLGTLTAPMRSLAPANEVGRPWVLTTETGRWALKQVTGWYGVESIVDHAETDARLQEAALAAGVVLPPPVRTREGKVTESIDGQHWRVNAWIESGPPLSAPASAAICRQAGAVLARIHNLALAADHPMEPWYRPLNSIADWEQLSARASAHNVEWAPMLERFLPNVADLAQLTLSGEPPETVLCHCGFGPGNARLLRDGRLAVLGWEHAGASPPNWELAEALLAWTAGPHGSPPDAAGGRALMEAYGAERRDRPRLELACFAGSAAAWLNYAYGQICNGLTAATEEAQQFAARNVNHLLKHAPSRRLYEQVLLDTSTTASARP